MYRFHLAHRTIKPKQLRARILTRTLQLGILRRHRPGCLRIKSRLLRSTLLKVRPAPCIWRAAVRRRSGFVPSTPELLCPAAPLPPPSKTRIIRAAGDPVARHFMNEEKFHPDDAKLSALLRESRSEPSLPARFQQSVWRRIEEADAPIEASRSTTWLDAIIAFALRPRFAVAVAVVLVAAGSLAGAREGRQMARHQAESRYIAAVAPNSLR